MSHYICKGRMPLMAIFVINFGAGILKVPYTSIVMPSVICGKPPPLSYKNDVTGNLHYVSFSQKIYLFAFLRFKALLYQQLEYFILKINQ